MKNIKHLIAAISAFFYSLVSHAAIPVVEDPSTGAQTGIYAFGSQWTKDLMAFGIPTVLGFVFLWMMWELWAKINEQRTSKEPQWNGVIAFGAACTIYFITAVFIGTQVDAIYT